LVGGKLLRAPARRIAGIADKSLTPPGKAG